MKKHLTAIIRAEDGGYTSLCPELDIASQGDTVEEARDNLREALELFFECAQGEEIDRRLGSATQTPGLPPWARYDGTAGAKSLVFTASR